MNQDNYQDLNIKSIRAFFLSWLHEVFAPIRDCFRLMGYAIAIQGNNAAPTAKIEINEAVLARAFIGSMAITATIDWLSEAEVGSEFLMSLVLIVLMLISTILIHPVLIWLGGKASFRQTFVVNVIATTVAPPISAILIVLSNIFGLNSDLAASAGVGTLIPLLAKVHQLSFTKITLAIVLGPFLIILMGVGALGLLVAALDNSANNRNSNVYNPQYNSPQVYYSQWCHTNLGTCQIQSSPIGNRCMCQNNIGNIIYGIVR
ncbi:hypothetical protein TI04_03905 [Achromatium sp. WMS2]|nr:hypothetical protein TI04_03905 [Achromatium sp. WMS2]